MLGLYLSNYRSPLVVGTRRMDYLTSCRTYMPSQYDSRSSVPRSFFISQVNNGGSLLQVSEETMSFAKTPR